MARSTYACEELYYNAYDANYICATRPSRLRETSSCGYVEVVGKKLSTGLPFCYARLQFQHCQLLYEHISHILDSLFCPSNKFVLKCCLAIHFLCFVVELIKSYFTSCVASALGSHHYQLKCLCR